MRLFYLGAESEPLNKKYRAIKNGDYNGLKLKQRYNPIAWKAYILWGI
jgi:hypothetical protein